MCGRKAADKSERPIGGAGRLRKCRGCEERPAEQFAPANAQKNWLVAVVCAGSKRISDCGIGALVGATQMVPSSRRKSTVNSE
jgi:hypothetical protein